jgi:hypothetical protein
MRSRKRLGNLRVREKSRLLKQLPQIHRYCIDSRYHYIFTVTIWDTTILVNVTRNLVVSQTGPRLPRLPAPNLIRVSVHREVGVYPNSEVVANR